MSGAGTPSKSSRVPPIVFAARPAGVRLKFTPAVGPRPCPKIEMISPGAIGPTSRLAAFTTEVRKGTAPVTTPPALLVIVSVTGTLEGDPPAGVIVITPA